MNSNNTDDSLVTPKKKEFLLDKNSHLLRLPEFSSWLAPCDEDKYKAKCKMCNKVLVAGRSELKKHADTSKM